MINYLVGVLIISGVFFFAVGTIGLLRLPDTISRIHAPTKGDTLGAGLIVLGLMIYNGFSIVSFKLLIMMLFIWLTSPTAASALALAALKTGKTKPELINIEDSCQQGSDLNA